MKKKTKTARKVLSVFLAVLMMISTWAVAVPGVLAADNKYYVKVYVNIYDGSDGYGGTYSVEESTGKPKNYSWATNDGWYGRINMTGFTVFGEKGDYDAQDVSAALLRAEKLNTYYAMSGLSNDNANGDWDSKRIDNEVYEFELSSFPVEVFWMNDENNWDGGNTGFAIRKLTVATSKGGTEHTMWEGLAGSDSETYNYYGSITPTGIHTCFEDYAKNYNMNDYKFYKAITTSSQRAWSDPYYYGSAGTYYLNEYANGGVSATFSEGVASVASTVDYIDTSSSDTYYVNFTNHSKTQNAEITGIFNQSSFVSSPMDSTASKPLEPGETRSFEINKSKYASLAKYNGGPANFTFTYTLDNVYVSDEINASLATFTQPTYIGLWSDSNITNESTTFQLKNFGDFYLTLQATQGVFVKEDGTGITNNNTDSVSFNFNYYLNTENVSTWEETGLRFHMKENNWNEIYLQNPNYETGTLSLSGSVGNPTQASFRLADFAFTSIDEAFSYNGSNNTAYFGNTITPTWTGKSKDTFATLYTYRISNAWWRFSGNVFKGSETSSEPGKIVFNNMRFTDADDFTATFSGTINVYAFDKSALRDYVRETLLDFAPMNLRYNTSAFETYQNKLADAMNVLANQKTTQSAVTNALAELKSAVAALQTTNNLVNQVDKLTHIQYVDDIGSEVAASTDARYVLVTLGEHTVPQKTEYIGSGEYKNATNKNADLKTNHTKADTDINIINYRYWNIDYSAVDSKIADLETAINNFDDTKYNNSFKTALQNEKDNLEAVKATVDVINTPTSQEDINVLIVNADNLIEHLGVNMRVHQWIEDDDGKYVAEMDENTHWYTCSICGYELTYDHYFIYEKIDEAQHKKTCVTNDETLIEGCGYTVTEDHIWVPGDTVASSCTEQGSTSYSCVCGATKTEALELAEHNFAMYDNGDGTHIEKCTVCGADKTDAVAEAHTYTYVNNNDGTHTATCSVCAGTVTVDHIFANPDLARPTYNEETHEWVNGKYTYTCACGAEKVEDAIRADYSKLEEVVDALEELKDNENLSNEAKEAIYAAIAKADNIADDLVKAEQDQIDALVKELQNIKADADEAIKNKEIGVEKITEANSGVKVQFIDESGLGTIDSIQLGKDNGFIIRVANGNADSDITITKLNGADKNITLATGESTDFAIDATGLTAGIATYTITYTIDNLKDADGNPVEFTTKAYLYVKEEAYQPYHYLHEEAWQGQDLALGYYVEANYGDFTVNDPDGAMKFNDNMVVNEVSTWRFDKYDYGTTCYDTTCTGGTDCTAKSDAHLATYNYYVDTSIVKTWEDAGFRTRFVETSASNYDKVNLKYLRLAVNGEYLTGIAGDDKTFTVTFVPSASGTQNATMQFSSTGDLTIKHIEEPANDILLFGSRKANGTNNTAYANFSGEIPVGVNADGTAPAMFMFAPKLRMTGSLGADEASYMTTHIALTSYDKAALREAVSKAEQAAFNSAYFDADKYEAYENALKNAKEVLGKAETNQNEVDAATAALNTAIENLKNAEAKFVLTVTHSIHENADKNSEATGAEYDYYLVDGEITPALKASIIALDTINKYDSKVTIDVKADATHTYNYWFINYSGIESAIEDAENIINDTEIGYSDEFKQDVEVAKNALEDILKDKNVTTTPESQKTVDDALEALTDLTGHEHNYKSTVTNPTCDEGGYTTHTCEVCGHSYIDTQTSANGHNWGEPELTTAPGVSTQGEYTEICGTCGTTQITKVDRAIYAAFDTVVGQLTELAKTENLTNEAAKAISDALEKANKLDKNLPADVTTADGKVIVGGQKTINDLVDELKKVVADTNTAIADGSALKPDYTKWEVAEGNYDALDKTNVKAEIIAEANSLKDTIAAKQGNDTLTQATATQKDIDEATARLNAIITGITDGSLRDPDYSKVEDKLDEVNKAENLNADTQDKIDAIEKALDEIKNKEPEANAKDDQAAVDALEERLDEILKDIADNKATKPNFDAWDAAEETYDAFTAEQLANIDDKLIDEVAGLKATINTLKADPTANAAEDQEVINNATARLNEINAIINGVLTEKPDFNDYDALHKTYEELVEQYGDKIKDSVAKDVADLDTIVDGVRTDETATKIEDQGTIDDAKTELEKIITGITDGSLRDPDYKDVEDKLDEVNKAENLNNDTQDKIDAIEKALDEIKNKEPEANAKDDQAAVDALEAELDSILKDIKDGKATKPDFDAWDAAEKEYNELTLEQLKNVKNEILNEVASLKATINTLKADPTANATEDQKTINDATARLNAIIAGIKDGSLKDPDYSGAENAIGNAEKIKTLTDEEKQIIADAKADLQKIKDKIEPEANARDDQDDVDVITNKVQDIINKYANCANGNHAWGTPVLTKVPTADAQGEYTETCGICGTTQITKVDRANYDEFNTVVDQVEALLDVKNLTDSAKTAINTALAKAEALDKNLPADVTTADGKVIVGGQKTINDLVDELKKVVADTNAAITNGSALKPDYTEWEEAETAYDALNKTNVKSEITAEANGLKDTIAAKQDNDTLTQATATQKDIDDATARLNEIIAGITNGSLKNPADFTEVNKDLADAKDKADKIDVIDSVNKDIADIEDKLKDLEGANADKQGEIDALEDQLEDIIAGITDGSLVKPDYTEWEEAETAYDALDKTNVKDEIITEANGLKNTIAAKQDDDTLTQKTATQKDINDATARLNEIIAGINDGSLKNPADFTEVNKDLADAKDKADNNDVVDGVKDDIKDIEEKLEALEGANADKQGEIDALEDQLEDIIAGITDGSLKKPDYEAWDDAVDVYDEIDKSTVSEATGERVEELKGIIDALKNDSTANAKEDQKTVDDATTELNGIIDTIKAALSEKPYFDGYDRSHDTYEDLVEQYGDKIKDSVAKEVANLDTIVEGIRGDETATKVKDQDAIDDAKADLDKIIAGINDGTLLEADFTEVEKDLEKVNDLLNDNAVTEETKTKIENIKDAINGLKTNPETNSKTQPVIDALEDQLEEIIAGIESGALVKPNYEAWEEAVDTYNDIDKTNVLASIVEEVEVLMAEIAEKQADDTLTQTTATQKNIDDATERLNKIIAGIIDGSLVKPDYTAVDNTIENAEALGDKLSDEYKAALDDLKAELDEIKNDPTSNKKDDQDDVDAIEEAVQAIIDKYADCVNGNHNWGTPELTTAPTADEQGEYTEICGTCGETQITKVGLADYDEFNAVVAELKELAKTENLTDEAIEIIADALAKAEALDKNLPADATTADGKSIEGGQSKIDALVEELNKVVADMNDAIEDGSALKPDYTEVDKDLADAKDKAENNDVIDGVKEDIADIEKDLNEIKNDPESTYADDQDDVDDLEKALEDIIAGIEDGSLVKPDYEGAEEAIKEAEKDIDGGKLTDDDKAALDELKKELDEIKNDPTSNKKDDQDDVDTIKGAAEAIINKYAECAKGNHSYKDSTVAPNCTEKGYKLHVCEICGKSYKDSYVDALGHVEVIIPAVEATCGYEGYTEGVKCSVCGEILTAQQVIPTLPHTDEDDDGVCDKCGRTGLYDGCACLCHNNHWFWRIVYMIFRIIWKIFKIHPVCACGRLHY